MTRDERQETRDKMPMSARARSFRSRNGRFCAGLQAVFLVLLASTLAWSQSTKTKSLEQLDESFVSLADKISPSVVQILVAGYGRLEQDTNGNGSETGLVLGRQHAIGSGVIVAPNGYIMTNAHVVSGAQRIQVALVPSAPGLLVLHPSEMRHTRILDATLVGADNDIDLALLKVDATNLPALGFASYGKLRQGEMVFAFGSPEGLGNSMTFGVVSSVARQTDPDSANVYIQTDAPINPGNSGGPLVDIDGEVVGLNTFIVTSSGGNQGLGFAIPSTELRFAYAQFLKYGHVHRPVIGADIQTITPALAEGLKLPQDWGLVISDVLPGGPAAAAGLQINDILIGVDGREVGSLPVFEYDLQPHVGGEKVHLTVLRAGQKVELDVPVIVVTHSYDQLSALVDPSKNLVSRIGIVGIDVGPQVASLIGSLRISSGVVVVAKAASATGLETELESGDVVHAVDGQPVTNLDGLRAALKGIDSGMPIVFQVERDSRLLYVVQQP